MLSVRWRWMLVPMIVVVAGCLPHPSTDLPVSFTESFGGGGNGTFTQQQPPAGTTAQDVVADLRMQDSNGMFGGRAVPVFGVVDCHGNPDCQPGPGGRAGGRATVWVLLYPDCKDPTGGNIGWAIVDTVIRVGGAGYLANAPCDR